MVCSSPHEQQLCLTELHHLWLQHYIQEKKQMCHFGLFIYLVVNNELETLWKEPVLV
jgi:hypothetical protein